MISPRRGERPLYPVVVTADGSAWCTCCGWEADQNVRDPYLLRVWSLEHVDGSLPCVQARDERAAAMARHPAGRRWGGAGG
jgi:hypothetical protein